jgi:hypothetical protein
MKTFVFAIGGTGARVLKAFTMLMAMDVKVKSQIVPVIIDMDLKNGDTQRTLKLLENYRIISQTAYAEAPEKGFFTNSFGTLGSVQSSAQNAGYEANSGIKDSFQLDFGEVTETFYQYIKANHLSSLNNDFLESLFDNSPPDNPHTELNLKLDQGFKGNPNLGSLVFNNLINTPEFKHFERVFSQGDRIFIVSSIFGGTGSSGFPQLVKNIRNSNNNFIREAPIGALVIKPYFRVAEDANSSINSDNFNAKTKSALTYYAEELEGHINSFYYLADKPGKALENKMGGIDQKNKAHIIEFFGAKAIMNYVNSPVNSNGSVHYEYGIKDIDKSQGIQELRLEDFHSVAIWKAFTKFSFFVKFFKYGLGERINKNEPFAKDLNLASELNQKVFYIQLKNFIDQYWVWLKEMEESERSFSPYNLEGPFSKFIKGKTVGKLDSGMFSDVWTGVLGDLWKEISKEQGKITNEEKFLRMMYACQEKIFDKYIQELPIR